MHQATEQPMAESHVAVVVTVPDDSFPDDDDICIFAGRFVCEKLETHLIQHGHSIPDSIGGGCNEDWGVYFKSTLNDKLFEYHICFFPGPQGSTQNQMLIQYHARLPFLKRLFRKPLELLPDDPMQKTMQSFGHLFSGSRMLTQLQLEREY